MKILCPIDFSEHSRVAVGEAVRIAKKTNSKIILFATYIVPKTAASFISLDAIVYQNTMEELQKFRKKINALSALDVEEVARKGPPARIICDFAEDNEIDLVVMGTQGSSNMQNILMGSVTRSVFKSSSVPVLAIPVDVERNGIGSKFLLAVDKDPILNDETLGILPVLRRVYNASLKVFHVSKKEDLVPVDPYLESYLPGMIEDIVIEQSKKTDETIKHYVVTHKIDLLIMIRRKKSKWEKLFLKGHTEEELNRTRIPMLMLPDKSEN